MSLKDIKFDEALRQEWIEVHSNAEVGMGEVRQGNCMCALGTLGQTLVSRGVMNWVPIPGTSLYNLEDPETGLQGLYYILSLVPAFNHDFTHKVWTYNDDNFDESDIEGSRAKMLEFIQNLPVEE